VHFGLGKINHYVEDFSIGINKATEWTNTWTPIIPNSQLIIYAAPAANYKWAINIFINPSSAITFIFFSTILVLLVIGVIIIYLHFKERKNNDEFSIANINLL
jgi:integrin alpha FG-GAP repeat containing protein 1